MNKILFVTNDKAPWIDEDFNILSLKFHVIRRHLKISYYLNIYQFFKDVLSSDLIYLWFGSFSAFPILILAKLFQKKIIIVSGGFDVARLDELRHGAFAIGKRGILLRRLLFKMADFIFCVSKSNREEAIRNAQVSAEKAILIPLGFEALLSPDQIQPWEKRKNQVISISSLGKNYFKIKGFDQLLAVAKVLPQISFVHLGHLEANFLSEIKLQIPANLTLKGFVPFKSKEFLAYLNESKIILQLSAYESFCSAIVEGALCGCYPITSDRFALPELTAVLGATIEYGDEQMVTACLLKTINSSQDCRKISEVFLSRFQMKKRQELILNAVQGLISAKTSVK